MVKAMKLPRVFYEHHAVDVFHHTYHGRVAPWIAADVANVRVSYVVAHAAVFHVIAQCREALAQCVHLICGAVQQEECEAESRCAAYSGQS